jgi:cholesterol oxidase
VVKRLSLPSEQVGADYTVVVIGSGYGGGVAASRLARAGQRVCVLERGKEWLPGEFPTTLKVVGRHSQVNIRGKHEGREDALYDFHVDDDINVFKGCGLGGTSLVNANDALEADPRVFERPCWPSELTGDPGGLLRDGVAHARAMLRPVTYPDTLPLLPKQAAQERSGARVKLPVVRVPINVSFTDGKNHVGVEQKRCGLCGDCVTGCNHGAKNTVTATYLADAKNHGAELFTGAAVRWLERDGDRWRVYFSSPREHHTGLAKLWRLLFGREQQAPERFVSADVVVLSAGTLGSTEILLRSKQRGLALSHRLGQRFTGNGDFLAFGYNNDAPVNGVGFGRYPVEGREPVGPCITTAIDGRAGASLEDGMIIEEGSLPGPVACALPWGLLAARKVSGTDTDRGFGDFLKEQWRKLVSLVLGPYYGAIRHTQTYLVMTHDDADGRMSLDEKNDHFRIAWGRVASQPIFQKVDAILRECTAANGGVHVPNPTWKNYVKQSLVTVHPLGGCAMGQDASQGVTNHRGQVYAGDSGTAVHEGLVWPTARSSRLRSA